MVTKIQVSILLVTVLFVISTNGIRWFDISSSFEDTDDIYDDLDDDLALYDDDSNNRILDDFKRLFNVREMSDDEKWKEIDNLDVIDDQFNEMIQMHQYSEVHGVKKYTLGKRIRGDKVVASSARNQTWLQYQDIKSNMTYPANGGVGRNLTYVEIQVNQTSNLGQAYVVRGGLGKRFITIIVEAYHTLYFNFKTSFYGL